jgi:hypothetical protein
VGRLWITTNTNSGQLPQSQLGKLVNSFIGKGAERIHTEMPFFMNEAGIIPTFASSA